MNFSVENYTALKSYALVNDQPFIYLVVFVIALILIASLASNILVILAVWQNSGLRTHMNFFLINLSLANLLFAAVVLPCTIVSFLRSSFIFGAAFCVVYNYVQGVSVGQSAFTLMILSFERYNAICRPLSSRRWQTTKHCYKMLALTWVVSLVVMIPIAATSKLQEHPNRDWKKCQEDWSKLPTSLELGYAITLDVLLFGIPLLTMSAAYSKIGVQISKSVLSARAGDDANLGDTVILAQNTTFECSSHYADKKKRTMPRLSHFESLSVVKEDNCRDRSRSIAVSVPGKRESISHMLHQDCLRLRINNKKKVIRMVIVVVLEYFICWAPVYALQTWLSIDKESALKYISSTMNLALRLMAYASTFIYPVTYCFMNSGFRRGCLQVFQSTFNGSKTLPLQTDMRTSLSRTRNNSDRASISPFKCRYSQSNMSYNIASLNSSQIEPVGHATAEHSAVFT